MNPDCVDPGAVANGHRHPTEGPYCHGVEIVYTCDAGYEMKGDAKIICKSTDQFNKPIPVCMKIDSGEKTIKFHL